MKPHEKEEQKFQMFMKNFLSKYSKDPQGFHNIFNDPTYAQILLEISDRLIKNPQKLEYYVNMARIKKDLTTEALRDSLEKIKKEHIDIVGNLNSQDDNTNNHGHDDC